MRAPGEAPAGVVQEEDGRLRLDADKGITLQVGASRLDISADGTIAVEGHTIVVDGETIHQGSRQRLTLKSPSIDLN